MLFRSLIGLVRNANCVVKQSLWQNTFTRSPVRATQYISNDGSIEHAQYNVRATGHVAKLRRDLGVDAA